MSSPIDHTHVTEEQIQSALSWKPRIEGEEILQRIVFQLRSDLERAESERDGRPSMADLQYTAEQRDTAMASADKYLKALDQMERVLRTIGENEEAMFVIEGVVSNLSRDDMKWFREFIERITT